MRNTESIVEEYRKADLVFCPRNNFTIISPCARFGQTRHKEVLDAWSPTEADYTDTRCKTTTRVHGSISLPTTGASPTIQDCTDGR